MIKELDDVYRYTHAVASRFPEITDEVELRPAESPPAGLAELESQLALPPSYVACAARVGLFGVSIGYFALWPKFGHSSTLIDALRRANLGDEPLARAMRKAHLAIVGREEANLICVGTGNSPGADVVHHLDISSSPEVRDTEIATDFEKFILLAANLHQIGYEEGIEVNVAADRIGVYCMKLGCNDAQTAFWRLKLSELLVNEFSK